MFTIFISLFSSIYIVLSSPVFESFFVLLLLVLRPFARVCFFVFVVSCLRRLLLRRSHLFHLLVK